MQLTQITPQTPSDANRNASNEPSFSALRPALFARYGDLEQLRYDYPLVLVDNDDGAHVLRPLSRIIDDTVKAAVAPGAAGEPMRQQVLRLEADIRRCVEQGDKGRLSDLWRASAAHLVSQSGEAAFGPLDTNLDAARKHLKLDGEVIGCDAQTPGKVMIHAWKGVHAAKARAFRKKVDGLILRLTDILKSDHMKSDDAHGSDALESAMGSHGDGSIDFAALSTVLHRARPEDRIPEERVQRIRNVLRILQYQPFFDPGRTSDSPSNRRETFNYVFESCTAALEANRGHLPDVVALTKALTIAELEVENKYRPELHDQIFERFDESDLTNDQMGLLPSPLVLLRDGVSKSAEVSRAFEALAFGLQITILIQTDDILGDTSPEPPRETMRAGTVRLASMAMGLNNAFALQSTSAHLYRMRDKLVRGMNYDGPAVFSIYSGATETVPDMPAYVLAAAATESRAFPSFTYDPSAGADWARRFDLSHNPQVTSDWAEHVLDFEDSIGQSCSEVDAFTFADFVICDRRYARFCHPLTRANWQTGMVPAADWLKLPSDTDYTQVPFVLGIDSENRLLRVAVDDKISEAARRCGDAWGRLQELAGINNSHVLRALTEERQQRESALQATESSATAAPAASAPPTPIVEAPAPTMPIEVAPDEAASDRPWIETARCTTCNECTQISSTLFAYNENMQAYVVDPDGGTYRQLVEAAESCQVSIIHPGQPRNHDEPNLEDLLERAQSFN